MQGKAEMKEGEGMEQKTDLNEAQSISLKIFIERLRDQKHSDKEVDYALRGLAAIGRIKATERAKDATQFGVIRGMSKNSDEFKKYVAISLPHLNPTKKIKI